MCRQLLTVLRIVAGYMTNHGQFSLRNTHYVLENRLTVLNTQIDALSRRTIDINALHTLVNVVLRQPSDSLRADIAFLVITCIKCRNHTLVFVKISHD